MSVNQAKDFLSIYNIMGKASRIHELKVLAILVFYLDSCNNC